MTDPRKVNALGRLATAALVVGFAALVSQQVLRPFLAAARDLGAFGEAVQILSGGEGDVDRLDAEIRMVSWEIAESKTRLPEEPNLDAFLEQLGQIGKQTRVRVEKLTPREIEDHRLFRKLKIEVHISGGFMAIYDFLIRLEGADQLSRVERLKVVATKTGDGCAADMQLALYFAPGKEG